MKPRLPRQKLGLACIVLAVGYFILGLWPFSFHPVNRVSRLTNRPGLRFEPQGVAYDTEALPADFTTEKPDQPASFSFEFWLEPSLEPSTDVFYILAIDGDQPQSNLVICQWKREFLVRSRDDASKRGFKEVGINDALIKQQSRIIIVTGDTTGTSFYLDGKLADHFPAFVLPARSFRGRMVLGNCSTGRAAWTGKLFGLAIFNRALDATEVARHQTIWTEGLGNQLTNDPGLSALYLFDDQEAQFAKDGSTHRHQVSIPSRYEVLRKTVLTAYSEESRDNDSRIRDIVVNLLGFVPFGVCALLYLHAFAPSHALRNGLLAVSAGALLSLCIELTQVWLPGRHSSMTDLACNTAGTLLGVALAFKFRSRTGVSASDSETPAPLPWP